MAEEMESRMETRPTVGIAGLGRMGQPIAANILKAGFPTIVWNRTREKATDLLERGAVWTENPAAVATAADIVLTSLADPAAVESVYFAPDGLLDRASSGTILVDLSTGSPASALGTASAPSTSHPSSGSSATSTASSPARSDPIPNVVRFRCTCVSSSS